MARKSNEDQLAEFTKKGNAILDKILIKTKPKVYKEMMKRFNAESSTKTGEGWEKLSEFYVKYLRDKPDENILVQTGELKKSIGVTIIDEPPSGGNFFIGTGNELAHQHNDGYTFTDRGGNSVDVEPRPCLEIPEEYAHGGSLTRKMIFKWFSELTELKKRIKGNI